MVTFITTNLVTLIAIIVWRMHPALVFAVWLPFVMLDGLYLSSALTKVPDGAWFTLLLAIILATLFTLWRYGKEKQWACEATDRVDLSDFIVKSVEGDNALHLADQYGGGPLHEIEGMAIFFDKRGDNVPTVYKHWLSKFRAQMEAVVFMHLRALHVPHVSEEDKFAVSRTSVPNVYRLIIRHGYNDHVITPDLSRLVYEEVRKAIIRGSVLPSTSAASSSQSERPPASHALKVADKMRRLDGAYETQALFLCGKEQMRICPKYNFAKRMALGLFLWVRENCRGRIEKLNVPVDKLVEVGFLGEL